MSKNGEKEPGDVLFSLVKDTLSELLSAKILLLEPLVPFPEIKREVLLKNWSKNLEKEVNPKALAAPDPIVSNSGI